MEPRQGMIGQVAFAIGLIAFGLSIGLFLVDLGSMRFAMAFRMLAPAILQGFSLFLFHESHRASRDAAEALSRKAFQMPVE